MKRLELLLTVLLVAGLISSAPAIGQETAAADAEAAQQEVADREAGEAAAAEGEEAEREEEENNRRRRMPSESKIDLGNEESIRVTWHEWPVEAPDFQGLAELNPGDVMLITASAPPKLWTHAALMFGETAIKTGNVAEDYPGVYGLWLKKTADGWNLIFNNKPDVWGTMYHSDADAGEIALDYAATESSTEKFTVELTEGSEGSGVLNLKWGEHHWQAPFTYSN